jgi:hypothetical protein
MDTYIDRAQALELEIAALEADQLAVQAPQERASIDARLASAKRSLQWYRSRLPRRIEALGVSVSETIRCADRP